MFFSAVAGFFLARILTKWYLRKKKPNSRLATERLMQSRNQTMRLNELKMLNNRLENSKKETQSLEKSVMRLEVVLNKLDELISNEQSAHSESLFTRFSKHLWHLLHEGASHNIRVEENLEFLEGGLALMSAMNQHSWAFEICTDKVAPIDLNRRIRTIVLSSWMFDHQWDYVLRGDIITSVELELSSDTYSITAQLRLG